jgi:hypothetical protein
MHKISHPNNVERSDADPRLVAALAIGVAVFLLAVPLIVRLSYPDASRLGYIGTDLPKPPEPRLQVRARDDLVRLRAAEHERLTGLGWLDRGQGIAHIPIDDAMKLLATRGLPGWPSSDKTSSKSSP